MNKLFFPFFYLLFFFPVSLFPSDSLHIKVLFLYGSKPKKEFKDSESKWFGGMLGGHVGIEFELDKVIDFVPDGKFHLFAKKDDRHSRFVIHSRKVFWEIFGGDSAKVKKTTVVIPVSSRQKAKLDSIVKAYTSATPYDYAFFGMRCGAATYDILAQLGVMKEYSRRKTSRKIFYPRKLRKRLFRKASENNWKIIRVEGSYTRKWEHD